MHQRVLQDGSGGAAGGGRSRDAACASSQRRVILIGPLGRWHRGGEWAEPLLETVGKQPLCCLPGSSESPHACHDCTALGKPLGLAGTRPGCAGGVEAEPGPLLYASAVSPSVGTVRAAGVSVELGGLLWEQRRVCHPTSPDPSLRGEGVGERCPFASSVPTLPPV